MFCGLLHIWFAAGSFRTGTKIGATTRSTPARKISTPSLSPGEGEEVPFCAARQLFLSGGYGWRQWLRLGLLPFFASDFLCLMNMNEGAFLVANDDIGESVSIYVTSHDLCADA